MVQSLEERFQEEMRRRADRPFGDVDLVTGRTLQPYSRAVHAGARNLLAKAFRVWRADQPRAMRYVEQAVRLPFDPHEESYPAAAEASMLVFTCVTEAVENALENDALWLDAAVAVLAEAESIGQSQLAHTLLAVVQDYEVDDHDVRRVRAAVAPIALQPELRDLVDLSLDELRRHVAAVVALAVAYSETLDALADEEFDSLT